MLKVVWWLSFIVTVGCSAIYALKGDHYGLIMFAAVGLAIAWMARRGDHDIFAPGVGPGAFGMLHAGMELGGLRSPTTPVPAALGWSYLLAAAALTAVSFWAVRQRERETLGPDVEK